MNQIYDKYGQSMAYYPEVPSILLQLHRTNIHIAAASRTSAPRAARQALTELLIPGSLNSANEDPLRRPGKGKDEAELISSIKLFDTMEIYPGSKLAHFKEIHKKTGIPYEEMVSRSPHSSRYLWLMRFPPISALLRWLVSLCCRFWCSAHL